MKNIRTIVYIDGFNLYYAIRDLRRPNLKWVDLWKLSETLLRKNEQLEAVNYFTAYTTWMPNHYYRHRQYVKALQAKGVDLVFGQFKNKQITCHKCGRVYFTKEEKETDVNIATALVRDAFLDKYDRAILISADTDLCPPLDIVREHFPGKEVFVVAPPNRFKRAGGLNPKYGLKAGRIANCLLPKQLTDLDGKTRVIPPEWDRNSK